MPFSTRAESIEFGALSYFVQIVTLNAGFAFPAIVLMSLLTNSMDIFDAVNALLPEIKSVAEIYAVQPAPVPVGSLIFQPLEVVFAIRCFPSSFIVP